MSFKFRLKFKALWMTETCKLPIIIMIVFSDVVMQHGLCDDGIFWWVLWSNFYSDYNVMIFMTTVYSKKKKN